MIFGADWTLHDFLHSRHGALGDGHGKVVERGFLRPSAYYPLHDKEGKLLEEPVYCGGLSRFSADDPRHKGEKPLLLVDAPIGYYFEIISKGFGAMPTTQPRFHQVDRCRIVAYVQALQLSRAPER